MRKISTPGIFLAILIGLFASVISCGLRNLDEEKLKNRVVFADPNLEDLVRKIIKKRWDPIYPADLQKIKVLSTTKMVISDLTGIENCKALEQVDFEIYQYDDILHHGFSFMPIVFGKRLSSSFSRQAYRVVLSDLFYEPDEVRHPYIGITSLGQLSNLTNLARINLGRNNIQDLSPLANLTKITYLSLWRNKIASLAPLSKLEKLSWLDLTENYIADISSISGLVNLKDLSLGNNQVTNLTPLQGLSNLKHLNLNLNNIADISPIASLANLSGLGLSNNNLTDISALSRLTKLTRIGLEHNRIADITPLASLINLLDVELGYNNIVDISPLARLPKLTRISLEHNHISDITALVEKCNSGSLGKGAYVYLGNNPLSEQALKHDIPYLTRKGVEVSTSCCECEENMSQETSE